VLMGIFNKLLYRPYASWTTDHTGGSIIDIMRGPLADSS
jgi:hypothetical protein